MRAAFSERTWRRLCAFLDGTASHCDVGRHRDTDVPIAVAPLKVPDVEDFAVDLGEGPFGKLLRVEEKQENDCPHVTLCLFDAGTV
jgi:hypothetical protein